MTQFEIMRLPQELLDRFASRLAEPFGEPSPSGRRAGFKNMREKSDRAVPEADQPRSAHFVNRAPPFLAFAFARVERVPQSPPSRFAARS